MTNDGWPRSFAETIQLARNTNTGHDPELLQRVHDALLLDGAVAVERVGR